MVSGSKASNVCIGEVVVVPDSSRASPPGLIVAAPSAPVPEKGGVSSSSFSLAPLTDPAAESDP